MSRSARHGRSPRAAGARRLVAAGAAVGGLCLALIAVSVLARTRGEEHGRAAPVQPAAPEGPSGGSASRTLPDSGPAPDRVASLLAAPAAAPVAGAGEDASGDGRRPARPGTEQACLDAFLAAAARAGADPLALADASLRPEAPLAERLAALRGLLRLRPAGYVARFARAIEAQAGELAGADAAVREFALRSLAGLAPEEPQARGALADLLALSPALPGVAPLRRTAASALAASSPPGELPALAAALQKETDAMLLAGVRARLLENPAAGPLAGLFPAAARPDPAAKPGSHAED